MYFFKKPQRLAGELIAVALCLSLSAACSDPENTTVVGGEFGSIAEAVRAPADPIAVASTTGCALDIDCQEGSYCFQGQCASQCTAEIACEGGRVCDRRGRCGSPPGASTLEADTPSVIPGLRIVSAPTTVFYIQPGQETIEVDLTLNQPAPPAGVAYVATRNDRPEAGNLVRLMESSGQNVSLVLEVGLASPDAPDARPVRVDIASAAGRQTITMIPEQPASGRYAGVVQIDTFGSAGLPIDLQLVTDPPGATLSAAQKTFLVLNVDDNNIFSPLRGADAPARVVSELVYDDFTDSYVATIRGRFDLTDGDVIRSHAGDQVERQMRFEIEIDAEGVLQGTFQDNWRGLYEARSAEGVISLSNVTYLGKLRLNRVRSGLNLSDIDTNQTLPQASPDFLPAAALTACEGLSFDVTALEVETDVFFDCTDIADIAAFEAAPVDAQARCAIAFTKDALQGETTASQIQIYIGGGDVGGKSFSEFMSACAQGTDGLCRPLDEVVCSRQLVSNVYQNADVDVAFLSQLLTSYLDATRETFLGQQFGSLQADTETRLQWLSTASYPAIVTSAVRELTEGLLNSWQQDVLDVHFDVLSGQLDPTGVGVLSREPSGEQAQLNRGELLLEMNQSFRMAIDSLTLATRRWDTLFINAQDRQVRANYVSSRARDLYLSAGILRDLNLAGGVGYLSATLGAGFGALQRELEKLSMNFNQLIYARDAEVVVSTSVDPTVSNAVLLGQLRDRANASIAGALVTVGEVLSQEQSEILTVTQLRNRLNNEVDDLKADLIDLCGLPVGCSISDIFTDPSCRVRVNPGECGFIYKQGEEGVTEDFSANDLLGSQAGSSIMAVIEAAQGLKISLNETKEFENRLELQWEQTDAFSESIKARETIRNDQIDAMKSSFAAIAANRDDELGFLMAQMAERQQARAEDIEGAREFLAEWDAITIGAIQTRMGLQKGALIAARGARALEIGAEIALQVADVVASGVPDDPTAAASSASRMGIGVTGLAVAIPLTIASFALETTSESLQLAADQAEVLTSAELEKLDRAGEIDDLESEAAMLALYEAAETATYANEAERDAIRNALELSLAEYESSLALNAENQELNDRRTAYYRELTYLSGMYLREEQARMQYYQRAADYARVTQRAQLVDAKLIELEQQRANVNLIVGSPAAVFGRANRITRAENELEIAKNRLMDWLVALEYYAVRPFMDQRIQILLAQNPYQLEKIGSELERLQNRCGGQTNSFTSELSVRKDLLSITQPQQGIDDETFTAEGVFRELLSAGYVPIDKRVRYSTDQSVGDLLRAPNNVLAATFSLDLTDFANLALTCNAKVEAIDIQLVGNVGNARPTVSLLYDGAGELRSCQPGIDAYVGQFGEGATNFGSVTYLRSRGRSISPVAGVNTFIEDSSNTTLAGLPLSSQYTILINKRAGENQNINWDRLEDIQVRIRYSYQDIFPEGQCE